MFLKEAEPSLDILLGGVAKAVALNHYSLLKIAGEAALGLVFDKHFILN